MSKNSNSIRKLTMSGAALALCLLLPFITGQMQQIGNALCPMHLPVLLAGMVCGWQYGLVVGIIAPILRFFLFGMPPIFPIGTAMAFELGTYGLISGLLFMRSKKKLSDVYISLIGAMLAGRVVWGIVRFVMAGLFGVEFSLAAFIAGGFTTAIPGIIVQLILIPILVIAFQKA
ncbi:MAG: ECF transporter S component, partial [Lachnospiraceae bacterium]|nr:ECF transporter S component [Lachnospiraceae bacterium]